MRKAYGDRDDLCFMSDRHNSIKKAIKNAYPGTCHEICSYHLLQNLKSRYERSGQNITQAFNTTVRAYTLLEYEYYIQQLGSINDKIRDYLDEVGPERWSLFHMPSNRYSTMTSNIVESVNAITNSAKNYSIIALLESLRQIMQSWFYRHKEDAQGTFTTLSSKYEKKMKEMSTDMRNLRVSPIIQMDPYEHCSYYYTSEAFRSTYQETIFPVGNPAEWIVPNDVHDIVVIVPNQKRSCGRLTEKRFRPVYEENITVKCVRCGKNGHNRRTCSNLVPLSQSNKNKERKMTKTGNTH
ncbi:uncharacterized protein LOC111373654 [Olea europaea var. sylvestris]|uniref:uncharacterized protein LOC111373654 n=1 Tax=Olea europaea var. sylvestris TaxID=158386 RepID=UPI000C1CD3A3|nr:uncharacterized protein LOC111373654 [Olea europaea var. sylvestris]